MISDVLFDAAIKLDSYLNDPQYSARYDGLVREEIVALKEKMRDVGAMLDAQGIEDVPGDDADKSTVIFDGNSVRHTIHKATTSFQNRVHAWYQDYCGGAVVYDRRSRIHGFLIQALELAQSCGCSRDIARSAVDRVYETSPGDKSQKIGCVMVTLATLSASHDMHMDTCGETELTRISIPDKGDQP